MKLNEKLANIQTKFKSKKSRFNSFGKYYFRSAEDILESIKPYLLEHGVTITVNEELIGDTDKVYEIPDKPDYSPEMLSTYLKSLLNKHLNKKEYEVLRLSYGLDCPRHSAKQIADILSIKGSSAYVRVSQLKKQAVKRLIDNVDHSQVVDYLPV